LTLAFKRPSSNQRAKGSSQLSTCVNGVLHSSRRACAAQNEPRSSEAAAWSARSRTFACAAKAGGGGNERVSVSRDSRAFARSGCEVMGGQGARGDADAASG
jgi:hypothetical protein